MPHASTASEIRSCGLVGDRESGGTVGQAGNTSRLRVGMRWAVVALLAAGWLPAAWAQHTTADPVDELRRALQVPKRFSLDPVELSEQLDSRRRYLQERVARLRTIGDMRRALELQGWKDEDLNPAVADVDWPIRDELANRLEDALREALRRANTPGRLAAIAAISEMNAKVRGPGIRSRVLNTYGPPERSTRPLSEVASRAAGLLTPSPLAPLEVWPFLMLEPEAPSGYARRFAADLIAVLRTGTSSERVAAARALGQINPDPWLAAPALGELLEERDPAIRRAAAEGLAAMMRLTAQLAKKSHTTTGVEASPAEVVAAGVSGVNQAARGLDDPDAEVRRLSLEAIRAAANALVEPGVLVNDPAPRDEFPPEGWRVSLDELSLIAQYHALVLAEREQALPLAQALNRFALKVAGLLSDPQVAVRVSAAETLEEMGIGQQKLARRLDSVPRVVERIVVPADKAEPFELEDPFGTGLAVTRAYLAAAMADSEARVRLQAVQAVEMLHGPLGAALEAVVAALGDRDRFIRWAAARTLRKCAPHERPRALAGLARLLRDQDLGVQMTAADTLESFGPDAADAVPALTAGVGRGDPEIRVAVIEALVAIGPAAQSAIPAIADALRHPDARVRRAAADALYRFGPAAQAAVPALRRVLTDSDEQVRRSASDALMRIEP